MKRVRTLMLATLLALGGAAAAFAQDAGSDRARSLQKAFTHQLNRESRDSSATTVLFALLTGAVVTWILIYAVMQWRQKGEAVQRLPRHALRLFNQLLGEMGLSWSDRALLKSAAQAMGMQQPCVMLMEPRLLERYAGQYADSLPSPSARQRARQRLEAVARIAFPAEPSLPAAAAREHVRGAPAPRR